MQLQKERVLQYVREGKKQAQSKVHMRWWYGHGTTPPWPSAPVGQNPGAPSSSCQAVVESIACEIHEREDFDLMNDNDDDI